LDLGIFVTVICLTGLLSKEKDDYFRKRIPVTFDIHKIHPYTTNNEANAFFTKHVVGVDNTAVTAADIIADAEDEIASCNLTKNDGLDVCVSCVEVYGARVKQYIADDVFAVNASPTAEEVLPYSQQMQACIHRSFKPHSVSYLFSSNVWTHFTWWCAMATIISMVFSVEIEDASVENTPEKVIKKKDKSVDWVLAVIAGIILAATIVMNILYSLWVTDGKFDIYPIMLMQLSIIAVLAIAAAVFYVTQKYDKSMNLWGPLWDNMLFDTLLLLIVPSISVMTALFRGWATYDMIMFIVTTGIVLCACCMADNLLVIMWASNDGQKKNELHGSIHAGMFLLIIFAFIMFATTNLPRTLEKDYFHSSLLSGLFIFFLFLVVVLPPVLLDIMEFKNAKTIIIYKMYAEFITRAIFFTVFLIMYMLPDAGKKTVAP
jgi:hypothetical protein